MVKTANEAAVVEVTGADDPGFADLFHVWGVVMAELEPDDPPVVAGELAAELFTLPAHRRARAWVARRDGRPVGLVRTGRHLDGINDAIAEIYVGVDPAERRRRVGSALLATALDAMDAEGVTSLIGFTHDEAGAGFCRAAGMTNRQDERCSRLRITDVDLEQQRRWIDEAPARAAGYRLETWVGVCPDEWAEPLAGALAAMVDAPIGDLDWHPQVQPGPEVQDRERWWDAQGYDTVTTLALAPDGSPAGASQLLVSRLRPEVAQQADTGVVGAHRGHRLGRWLKAETLRLALSREPRIAVVETYNAEENPYMLAINVDMGFRPHHVYGSYQGPVAGALAAFGSADG